MKRARMWLLILVAVVCFSDAALITIGTASYLGSDYRSITRGEDRHPVWLDDTKGSDTLADHWSRVEDFNDSGTLTHDSTPTDKR